MDEILQVLVSHFYSHVYHKLRTVGTYSLQSVVEIANVDQLAVEKTLVLPSQLLGALLGHQEPRSQLLRLDLEEASELVQVHGGIESQVRLDGGAPHVGLDLIHENSQMVLDGVNIGLGVLEVRRDGRNELGAGSSEEIFEDGQRLGAATLQLEQLVAVLLTKGAVDGVIQSGGVESHADGD